MHCLTRAICPERSGTTAGARQTCGMDAARYVELHGGCHYAGIVPVIACSVDMSLIQDPGVDDISALSLTKASHLFHRAAGPVACSHWLAAWPRRLPSCRDMLFSSIPNPIETSVFHPCARMLPRERLGWIKERKILLFWCRNVGGSPQRDALLWHALRHLAPSEAAIGIQWWFFVRHRKVWPKNCPSR